MIANRIEVPLELIKYIASLPDDDLKLHIRNKSQSEVWKAMRYKNELLSESWYARHNGGNEPLEVYLKSGVINKDYYEISLATLDYLNSLWLLCQRCFSKILKAYQAEAIECPFESAFNLFTRIVSDRQNAAFIPYLEGYIEFSKRDSTKVMRLHAKKLRGLKLSDKEAELLEGAIKKKQPTYDLWAEQMLIGTAKKFATRNNPGIKAAYDSLMENWARLDELTALGAGKMPSYAMQFGKITKVGQKGGYFASIA